jgi:hypothetical protein
MELNLAKLKFLSDFGIENDPSFFAIVLLNISFGFGYVKGLGLSSLISLSKPRSPYIKLVKNDIYLWDWKLRRLSIWGQMNYKYYSCYIFTDASRIRMICTHSRALHSVVVLFLPMINYLSSFIFVASESWIPSGLNIINCLFYRFLIFHFVYGTRIFFILLWIFESPLFSETLANVSECASVFIY